MAESNLEYYIICNMYIYAQYCLYKKIESTVTVSRSSGKKGPWIYILNIDRSEGSHNLLCTVEEAVWIVYTEF